MPPAALLQACPPLPHVGELREGEADIPPKNFPATVYRANPAKASTACPHPTSRGSSTTGNPRSHQKTAQAKSSQQTTEMTEPLAPWANPPVPAEPSLSPTYDLSPATQHLRLAFPTEAQTLQHTDQLFSPGACFKGQMNHEVQPHSLLLAPLPAA